MDTQALIGIVVFVVIVVSVAALTIRDLRRGWEGEAMRKGYDQGFNEALSQAREVMKKTGETR